MYNFAHQLALLTAAETGDVGPSACGNTPKDESDNGLPSLAKTKIPILVDDSRQLIHTTDTNAARYVMRQRKFFLSKRCWMPLSTVENVAVEDLVGECLKEGTARSGRTTIEKRISVRKPLESFLVDPEAITLGDIAVFFTLKASKGSAESLSPTLKNWFQFCAHHFQSLSPGLQTDSPLTAQKAPATRSNLKTDMKPTVKNELPSAPPTNFIRQIIEDDINAKKHDYIVTRFPPEPNGFLHLGHAKSICLNFGLAQTFNGRCHLRFDDTNPTKEDMRYITSIQEDVKWLGGDWGSHLYYASDYFQQLYELAVDLIKKGYAYVDDQTENEVRKNRGDVNTPGVDSPYRNRSPEENLRLFEAMRAGQCLEGSRILRAKIDMKSGNMNLRDPPIYRVRFASHPRTQNTWCIYPIYDFAHGQSDSIEHITHSICTLEFEDHRPLYEWFQEKLNIFRTRQIEFARLNCTYLVMSKRKLITLVEGKHVNDWDDPRLPTISGMRRKGYPAAAIRDFCERIGVAKRDTTIPLEYLETCVSNAIHPIAYRRHVITDPVKVIITNFPENKAAEELECPNHPEDASLGTRKLHFSRELYIDRSDFVINPPPKFFRLYPNNEVRLRYGYWIKCADYKLDPVDGKVLEIYCTYDPATKGGNAPPDNRKVKGTLHWISAVDAIDMEVRIYDRLFTSSTPDKVPEGKQWLDFLNPSSLTVYPNAKGERSLGHAVHPYREGEYYQFERVGFFVADYDSTPSKPIFNLTVPLTDSWAAKTDSGSREAQNKEAAKQAREQAALERQKKKAEKERRLAEKTKLKAAAV